MKRILLALLAASTLVAPVASAATFYQNDFNSQSSGALQLDSNWKIMPSGGTANSPAIRLTYAAAGTNGNQATLPLASFNTQEFWLDFDARIEGTMNGGMKFVKIFGSLSTPSQNNSTFIMDYVDNTQNRVVWYMDTICEVSLGGTTWNPECSFTPVKTGDPIDLRGNVWHHVKIHFVRATPGTNTGEYQIWIDGIERAHFKNLNNNSPVDSSTQKIDAITFGDYTNSNNSTWYFWIDNLTVSSADGNVSTSTPPTSPSAAPAIQGLKITQN